MDYKFLEDKWCNCRHKLIEVDVSKTSKHWKKVIKCCDCDLIHDYILKDSKEELKTTKTC